MAVRKYVRFAAPYRSKTFNDTHALMIGQNGVLNGGEVSQSGPTVTIQPLTFVQNGGIVDVNVPLSIGAPTMAAPYFVAISVTSMIENLGETITPVFVKRPQDAAANLVLVAEFDGDEWRALPKLQIDELLQAESRRSIVEGLVGIGRGFNAEISGPDLLIEAGALVGADGRLVEKSEPSQLPLIPSPMLGGTDRIDHAVFRKPQDSPVRIGTTQLLVGGAYPANGSNHLMASLSTLAGPTGTVSDLRLISRDTASFFVVGYIEDGDLKLAVFDDDYTLISTDVSVATGVDEYDMCITPDGLIDVSFTRGTSLYYMRLNTAGSVIYSEALDYTGLDNLSEPRIICVGTSTAYQVHMTVCRDLGGGSVEIGYLRRTSSNTQSTPYQSWINLSAALANPSLDKDDDDSLLFIAFANSTTERAYLRTYDASTAAPSAAPTQVGPAVELQTEVRNLATSTTLPVTGASHPIVRRAANKEVFVFFRHFKSSGQYGIAVYNARYKQAFGYKALMFDDTSIEQDYFAADIDNMNNGYISYMTLGGSPWIRLSLDLERAQVIGTGATIDAGAWEDPQILFTSRGELFHIAHDGSDIDFANGTALLETNPRDQRLCPTDVYIAHYRVSDAALSVAGTALEEDIAVRRIYEMLTACAATGTVTWNKAAANTLVIASALTLRFFNRYATYTIPTNSPGGVVIPAGSMMYVLVPDEDESQNLTPVIQPIGEGILDRHGRRAVILFWNIGGVLYTKFPPFRLGSSGETIIIGDSLSQEMLDWLGATDQNPDASNHGYTSIVYITQADSHNTSIGKLDAALAALSNSMAAGRATLNPGDTSVAVALAPARANANYYLGLALEAVGISGPMIQSTIVTARTTGGFTVEWPNPIDDSGYSLSFILKDA